MIEHEAVSPAARQADGNGTDKQPLETASRSRQECRVGDPRTARSRPAGCAQRPQRESDYTSNADSCYTAPTTHSLIPISTVSDEIMTDLNQIGRREFGARTLGALLTYSLLESLAGQKSFAADAPSVAVKWIKDVNDLAGDVKEQRISQVMWQKKIEELYGKIELPELLKLIDFEGMTKSAKLVDVGALSLRPQFPKVEGLPTDLVFGRQVFALKKDRSVVPHGHDNMATAFLILKGDLHGRHYDRIEDQAKHLIIKPTIDRAFKPGERSTVSDYKDNIHWFKATSETAFIFNIHILNVRPGSTTSTGRVYVDPDGEQLKDGLIRAPRMDYNLINKKYG